MALGKKASALRDAKFIQSKYLSLRNREKELRKEESDFSMTFLLVVIGGTSPKNFVLGKGKRKTGNGLMMFFQKTTLLRVNCNPKVVSPAGNDNPEPENDLRNKKTLLLIKSNDNNSIQ